MNPIRPLYEQFGVDEYYKNHADDYANPHLDEVRALIVRHFGATKRDAPILDFAAGGGEVSSILKQMGFTQITGCDPFTSALYERQTALPCLKYSFLDVIKGENLGRYSAVICSFALHLCPEKDLWPIVWNLLEAAPVLVVLSPHKRPALEGLAGIEVFADDFTLTPKGKKVRLKMCRRIRE